MKNYCVTSGYLHDKVVQLLGLSLLRIDSQNLGFFMMCRFEHNFDVHSLSNPNSSWHNLLLEQISEGSGLVQKIISGKVFNRLQIGSFGGVKFQDFSRNFKWVQGRCNSSVSEVSRGVWGYSGAFSDICGAFHRPLLGLFQGRFENFWVSGPGGISEDFQGRFISL